jgi:hypothetical protein
MAFLVGMCVVSLCVRAVLAPSWFHGWHLCSICCMEASILPNVRHIECLSAATLSDQHVTGVGGEFYASCQGEGLHQLPGYIQYAAPG